MARTRRYIEVGKPYELILRVREGLPFKPGPLINLLLMSILARAQRDGKVIICHYQWMGNHVHIILIPLCPLQCIFFYQEVQKKITDAFKRLLGKRRLSLWEGDPVLAQILDVEKGVDRVAYLYANPANAGLVDSIDEYPGLSTWMEFLATFDGGHTAETKAVPWIRLPSIEKLPDTLSLSETEESRIVADLKSRATINHELRVEPNTWMTALGVTEQGEIHHINKTVIRVLRENEAIARNKRIVAGKTIIGAKKLLQRSFCTPHEPKREEGERRVYVLSSFKELRIAYIEKIKDFCQRCKECYVKLKEGILEIDWPSEAFRPWAPPLSAVRV